MARKTIQEEPNEKIPGMSELMRLAASMDSSNALRIDDGTWEAVKEMYSLDKGKSKRIAECSFGKLDDEKFYAKCSSPDLRVNVVGRKRDIVNIVLLRSLLSVGYTFRKKK